MKLLFILACVSTCCSFEVLIATPGLIKSLHGLFSSIVLGLADAGHNITFITSYQLQQEHENVTSYFFPELNDIANNVSMFHITSSSDLQANILQATATVIKKFWSNPQAMQLWEKRNNYDLVIGMSYFSEMMYPFLMNIHGSFVQVCTPGVEPFSIAREGNWLTPSVVPAILLNYDENMSFWERAVNLPATIGYYFMEEASRQSTTMELRKYFPDIEDVKNYYDRIALTLINGHFALDSPVPLLPSQIEIGTINTRSAKPLPEDLENFMSGAGDAGVIYFSLGSLAKSSEIPRPIKLMFVEAFKRVPQRVVWKYEGDDLDLPANVLTKGWMPQQDILGHKKTRVFISHCGNLGTQEAKYHGVPVLAVPIAFDQPRNAARMERKGYAILINWKDLTTEKIVESLDKLINDTTYIERLKAVAMVLHDQKETPIERAVWWMEYIVRHKGAPHMRYAGRRLSLFQYVMLDVILFWAAIFASVLLVVVCSIRVLFCRRKRIHSITTEGKKKVQ